MIHTAYVTLLHPEAGTGAGQSALHQPKAEIGAGDGLGSCQKQLIALHQRLLGTEKESLKRSRDLNTILDELKQSVSAKKNATENLINITKWKVWNNTSKRTMQLTNVFSYLPHLLDHDDSLQPNVLIGQGRTAVSMVIGIPTVKRDKQTYLMDTLSSLLRELSHEERNDCVIVVLVAEVDMTHVRSIADSVNSMFPKEVKSGLIEVISPPASFYPDLSNLKETLGDTQERVRWRTKQNLDYSFLMLYAQPKGTYYVQLEDDVIARPTFFQSMKAFADQQSSTDWIVLEFSQLGFIGKLFRSSHLPLIIDFFLMFYKDKPIDWLLDHFLWVKVCNPEKDAKHCESEKANVRIRYRPSLFQHVGTHSSLPGKVQNLKDKDFEKILYRSHANPAADVSTTLKIYQEFTLEKAYKGENYFWAFAPVAGDYIKFNFSKPLLIDGYVFKTGNSEHPGDKLFSTAVDILPGDKSLMAKGGLPNDSKYQVTEDGYLRIDAFENGVAEQSIDPSIGNIEAIRLSILSESPVWVLLSEIGIKIAKTENIQTREKQ
ncbi:alpha-1,3-mannosyl-glycoprotein 4-beta-N-acetylglucosaminyltransferase-like protein MGAT4D [Protopterus annectens]|uniref:alpha-1,3-mannosyl-glycoprotein 4-beta-N-acetylglucosaminyltransferase-like protein MGAT4D n=1 Tax=Protopterus annectens TaxID=7888 RepID=UPI001CFAAB94|nr:alpha-1,3-mannosyl-glycoprotein 4-beta-N-acetylglucosaminyltransferase-like protein MGAT4D [Protopterus annectens]